MGCFLLIGWLTNLLDNGGVKLEFVFAVGESARRVDHSAELMARTPYCLRAVYGSAALLSGH